MVLSHFRDRKVVVLDFWAIWCMPCLMAMPELQQLHEEIGGRVEVVAVNLGEDPDKVRRFVDREGYTFTVVEDPDQEVGGLFGVNAIPMAVVVGTDGLVKSIEAGYRPGKVDGLRELLEQLTESAGPDST